MAPVLSPTWAIFYVDKQKPQGDAGIKSILNCDFCINEVSRIFQFDMVVFYKTQRFSKYSSKKSEFKKGKMFETKIVFKMF